MTLKCGPIKLACCPCIRGHRSSTCNHRVRLLWEVRKRGRPLMECPHAVSDGEKCLCTMRKCYVLGIGVTLRPPGAVPPEDHVKRRKPKGGAAGAGTRGDIKEEEEDDDFVLTPEQFEALPRIPPHLYSPESVTPYPQWTDELVFVQPTKAAPPAEGKGRRASTGKKKSAKSDKSRKSASPMPSCCASGGDGRRTNRETMAPHSGWKGGLSPHGQQSANLLKGDEEDPFFLQQLVGSRQAPSIPNFESPVNQPSEAACCSSTSSVGCSSGCGCCAGRVGNEGSRPPSNSLFSVPNISSIPQNYTAGMDWQTFSGGASYAGRAGYAEDGGRGAVDLVPPSPHAYPRYLDMDCALPDGSSVLDMSAQNLWNLGPADNFQLLPMYQRMCNCGGDCACLH